MYSMLVTLKVLKKKLARVPLDAKLGAEQIENDHFALLYIVYLLSFVAA